MARLATSIPEWRDLLAAAKEMGRATRVARSLAGSPWAARPPKAQRGGASAQRRDLSSREKRATPLASQSVGRARKRKLSSAEMESRWRQLLLRLLSARRASWNH